MFPIGNNTGDLSYMECRLIIDSSDGWESSVSKILTNFKDVSYQMAPFNGVMYVKGKADPKTILKKLKKGDKHIMIDWINFGIQGNDQHQLLDHNNYWGSHDHDPFYSARYPYNGTYYNQFNPTYPYTSYNMQQNAIPYGNEYHFHEYGPYGQNNEGRNYPDISIDSQYPARSRHHHSPMTSQSGNSFVENPSPPFFQSGTGDQANNQPRYYQSSPMSFKKVIQKFFSMLLCSKK